MKNKILFSFGFSWLRIWQRMTNQNNKKKHQRKMDKITTTKIDRVRHTKGNARRRKKKPRTAPNQRQKDKNNEK